MGQNIPNKHLYPLGTILGAVARRGVSYTPAAAMTIRQWSFVGVRVHAIAKSIDPATLAESNSVEWEIRTGTAGNKPNTTAASLMDSGSFDWRYTSAWAMEKPIKYTVNLTAPLELVAATQYWFILKFPDDAIDLRYPLAWVSTYETGAAGEVSATVYSSHYKVSWVNGDNSYNHTLYIFDDHAGVDWHCVLNEIGYMQPDKMRGYRTTQAASGLAQGRGGQSEWSQLRYPYSNFSQDNWMSGSGQLVEEDADAFLYSQCLETQVPHQAIIGPQVNLTGIECVNSAYEPTAITARTLPDAVYSTSTAAANYVSQMFTAPAGGIASTLVEVRLNYQPWHRNYAVTLAIFSDNGSDAPNANLTGFTALTDPPTYKWHWRGSVINQALAAGTKYHVVVKSTQPWGFNPEFRLMYDQDGSYAGGAAKYSVDAGTNWAAITGYSLAFRINYGTAGAMNGNVKKMVYGTVNGTLGLYAAAGKEVYVWSEGDGHWDPLTAALTADATDLIIFDDYLFVAQGYANNAKKYLAGWAGDGDAYKVFHISKGWLWMSDTVNTVRHKNAHDGALSAAITVGPAGWDITAMITYSGKLLVGREDGAWEIDDQDLARATSLMFREHADPSNCIGWTVWSGMLFVPVQNSIWRWQGSQYREVGPTDKRSGPTAGWPNKITRMTSTAPYLVATTTPIVTGGWGGLLFYNGLGWHHVTMATSTDQESYAVCVTTELGTNETRIWWAEGARITYSKWPVYTNNRYDWPSAKFNVTSGSFIGSWWDGGLKDALKFWNRVTVFADIPAGTSIEVYAARNGEDWGSTTEVIWLGELTPQDRTDHGEFVLQFPDGMVAKSIQPLFILATTDNSKTPRLKAYNMEAVVRQPPVYVTTFRLLLANNITKLNKSTESTRTADDMWEELQRAARRNDPIILSFPNKTMRCFISALSEETIAFKPDGMNKEKWERVAIVGAIEAS